MTPVRPLPPTPARLTSVPMMSPNRFIGEEWLEEKRRLSNTFNSRERRVPKMGISIKQQTSTMVVVKVTESAEINSKKLIDVQEEGMQRKTDDDGLPGNNGVYSEVLDVASSEKQKRKDYPFLETNIVTKNLQQQQQCNDSNSGIMNRSNYDQNLVTNYKRNSVQHTPLNSRGHWSNSLVKLASSSNQLRAKMMNKLMSRDKSLPGDMTKPQTPQTNSSEGGRARKKSKSLTRIFDIHRMKETEVFSDITDLIDCNMSDCMAASERQTAKKTRRNPLHRLSNQNWAIRTRLDGSRYIVRRRKRNQESSNDIIDTLPDIYATHSVYKVNDENLYNFDEAFSPLQGDRRNRNSQVLTTMLVV